MIQAATVTSPTGGEQHLQDPGEPTVMAELQTVKQQVACPLEACLGNMHRTYL